MQSRKTVQTLLVCCLAISASAQIFTANITGVVTDPSGAAIGNAEIRVVNGATREERSVKTDDSGRYTISQLAPGKYELTITASGFKKFVTSGIELTTNQSAGYDARMTVGEATQSVEIEASAVTLDTQTANKNVTFNKTDMLELPQGLRSPLLFVHATAGVNAVRQGIQPYMTDQNTNRFSLNGGRDESSAILVDGVPIKAPGWGGAIAVPSQDAVAETQVVRQAYDTQYGQTDGGAVTVVTKSGSNEFHGSLFEFLRNDHLDANSWANNKFGTGKTTFQRHQYGANVGGPISKKHGLYFFSAFEGLAQGVPQNSTLTVPTAAMKQGDFSQVKNSDGSLALIYDPFSYSTDASGAIRRTVFAGNRIPSARFDPVGKNVVNLFLDPNQSTVLPNGGYFSKAAKYVSNYYKIDERIDWVASEKVSLWGRYTQAWQTDSVPIYMGNGADSSTGEVDTRFHLAVGNTWVLSPTFVVNILAGFGRWHEDDTTSSSGYADSIGLPPSLVSQFQADTLPQFQFNNYSQIGYTEHNQNVRELGTFQINVSKEMHAHSIKFGGLFSLGRLNTNDAYSAILGFDSGMTSGPVAQTSSNTSGNDIASLLLGTGNGGSSPYNAQLALSQHDWAFYAHDTWKISRALTVTLGLRYEYQSPRTERYDRLVYFDFDAVNPLSAQTGLNLKGGLVYNHPMWNPDYKNLAPRASIAYRLSDKMVMRAGYGVFYQPAVAVGNGSTDGFSTSTNWIATQGGNGFIPANLLANPFPNGLNQPQGGSAGLSSKVGQSVNADSLLHPTGYVQTYSLDFQYQLGTNGLVEVGYVGVGGRKLALGAANMNINQLYSQYLPMGTALNQPVANPFYGVITDPTSVLSGKTVPQWRLLVPYPQYSSVILSPDTPGSSSSFNALTLKYNQRFKAGVSLLATYQFSKAIDNVSETQVWEIRNYSRDINNLADERSISGHDVPQDFRMTVLWELPVGRGKKFGANMSRAADAVVGGWRVSTIVRLADGLPLQFTSTNSNGTYGYVVQRPNITSLSDLANVPGGRGPDHWFNKAAVSIPAAFTIGNAPRYTGNIRTGALNDTDFLISKQWVFHERYRIQFRAEAYNFTNTPQYGAANTSAQSGGLGTVTGTTNVGPRNVQFGLRLEFWGRFRKQDSPCQ